MGLLVGSSPSVRVGANVAHCKVDGVNFTGGVNQSINQSKRKLIDGK